MKYLAFILASLLLWQCERPCPADINLGDLNLSGSTRAFVPTGQRVDQMTFVNATGQKLTFNNVSGSTQAKRFQLNVETMCQRGDLLDKTAQTAYFNAESIHLYYQSGTPNYTLAVDAQPENAGAYGSKNDTVFYETFAVSGQRIDAPSQVGSLRLLSSERGNSAKIPDQTRTNNMDFRLVGDTTILGKNIKNAWTTSSDGPHTLYVFYTQSTGIEAFTTKNGEQWIRQ
jgi:hypothetical protein